MPRPSLVLLAALSTFLCSAFVELPQNPLGPKKGNPLARPQEDPLVGTWRGDELQVHLEKQGSQYAGTFELGGAHYPFSCRRNGDGLEGTLTAEGEQYPFTADKTAAGWTFHSGGVDYPVAKAAAADAATESIDAGGAIETGRLKTKAFKHPLGFEFQHPETWTVQSSEDGIIVLPANVEKDAHGTPVELFLISSEGAEGATRPDQPEVVAFFDNSMAEMLPGMKRKGKPEALACLLGPGAATRYSGKTPTGLDGHAEIYVTLYRSMGVYMVHLGREDLVEQHRPEARQMFSSFGWKPGQIDPDLVALWYRNESTFDSSGGLNGATDSVSTTTNRYWEFKADGTVRYSVGSRVSVDVGGGNDGADAQASYSTGKQPKNTYVGSWSVGPGKQLVALWNGGGLEKYTYNVFTHTDDSIILKLIPAGSETSAFYHRQ